MLNESQKEILRKYNINPEQSVNQILDELDAKTALIGFDKELQTLNAKGDELEHLFDELFPLGEDEYE